MSSASWQSCHLKSSDHLNEVAQLNLPTVDVAAAGEHPQICSVSNDDCRAGEWAGQHLLQGGFEHYYFCGVPELLWSQRRRDGFLKSISPMTFVDSFYESLSWWESTTSSDELAQWLSTLPKASAIFCCHDATAVKVSRACDQAGLAIPQHLAIMGVDDDDVLCELSRPPLTSIPLNVQEIGYRAAETLASLMDGEGGEAVFVSPMSVVERSSTQIYHCKDPLMVEIMQYIFQRSLEGINVANLLMTFGIQRRNLELRFKKAYGTSPLKAMSKVKINRALQLLKVGDLNTKTIAEHCGYQSLGAFHTAFKKFTGHTPTEMKHHLSQDN